MRPRLTAVLLSLALPAQSVPAAAGQALSMKPSFRASGAPAMRLGAPFAAAGSVRSFALSQPGSRFLTDFRGGTSAPYGAVGGLAPSLLPVPKPVFNPEAASAFALSSQSSLLGPLRLVGRSLAASGGGTSAPYGAVGAPLQADRPSFSLQTEASAALFDGKRVLHSALDFEPPTFKNEPPQGPTEGAEASAAAPRLPTLSFKPVLKTGLLAIEPAKAIYGAIKKIADNEGSRQYWAQYRKGVEIEVVSRNESVFGRPTTITQAFTKPIGRLTKKDFAGIVPAYQLQASIKILRAALISHLEEERKQWKPYEPPVTLKSKVRVMKFKSFLQLYRETNGAKAVPTPAAPAPRAPLKVKPEGALEPLSLFLPRVVYLDVDALEGPMAKELLADMSKLQHTGVYFVAFSRKPYGAPGSIKEKIIRGMSSYQIGTQLPIRFMAVTDDGAVVSEFTKNGTVVPIDVDAFTELEMDVLRDSARKAFETTGLPQTALREKVQPPIKEAADEFPGFGREKKAAGRVAADPRVRYEVELPKMADEAVSSWVTAFTARLKDQGIAVRAKVNDLKGGRRSVSFQKTDRTGAMDRLKQAMGRKFGLYVNPGDILVLSDDPELLKANPSFDFGGLTGLKGAEQVENALGLMLGEHRENVAGDLTGSASRMNSFSYNKGRYLSELLIDESKAEQNINFFSGHMVHAAMGWLIWNLQNGRTPTASEYEANLRERWEEGLREFKPVGIPNGEDMEGWLRESVVRGRGMYEMVRAIHERGEVLVGTEIPNFFVVKDREKRSGELKRRFILHTIFDFIALRLDKDNPGHAALVIYDFKTGPAQSKQNLDKDLQVLTYALFANEKWVGKTMPFPYLSGGTPYVIDSAGVEFIYGAVKQVATITRWDLEKQRKKIIRTLTNIHRSEQQLLGEKKAKKPAKKASKKTAKKKG